MSARRRDQRRTRREAPLPTRGRSSTPWPWWRPRDQPIGRRPPNHRDQHDPTSSRSRQSGCSANTRPRDTRPACRSAVGRRAPRVRRQSRAVDPLVAMLLDQACRAQRAVSSRPADLRPTTKRGTRRRVGHRGTRRNPNPIWVTAVSGSAFQRSDTALSPDRPEVTIQAAATSPPCSSTRGTGVYVTAHSRRTTSLERSMPLACGDHFTKQRWASPPTSYVRPPTSLLQTSRSGRSPASLVTAAGATCSLWFATRHADECVTARVSCHPRRAVCASVPCDRAVTRYGQGGHRQSVGHHLGPQEPGELAGDGGGHHGADVLVGGELTEAAGEADLGRPRTGDASAAVTSVVAVADAGTDAWGGADRTRPLRTNWPRRCGVTGPGDVAAIVALLPGRVLRRDQPGETHERSGPGEPPPVEHLGGQTQTAETGHTPIGGEARRPGSPNGSRSHHGTRSASTASSAVSRRRTVAAIVRDRSRPSAGSSNRKPASQR